MAHAFSRARVYADCGISHGDVYKRQRMALGAQKRGVMHLVLRQGFLLVLVGVAVGLAAAIGVTRFMNSMLYKVHTTDPVTFAGVAILLSLVALVACTIPARRAMRVDPIVALRCE